MTINLSVYVINLILILSHLLHPSTCSSFDIENQIRELKIKAITSVELSSYSFDELPSLYFLFDTLTNKRFESIYKNDTEKFEEFKKIHQYYAIKNSFYSLKLSDVMIIESFNAGDLDIIRNKVNWTESEIRSFGFLGKEKDVPKYQFSKKDLIFHEKALADFFIAQYLHDNLIHPKDHPNDDEMELRIRFFLHITADHYNYYYRPLSYEFILGMIEEQKDEILNDQVRMIMKYRFRYLLDRFLPDQLYLVDKISKIFQKDEEVLKNLWGIDANQPYFLRFFRFLTTNDKVYKLKEIAEKFFKIGDDVQIETDLSSNLTKISANPKKPQADNIFRGKNQILNVLYLVHQKKDESFTTDFLNVTKYAVDDEILQKLNQTENFLDFVDSSSYSKVEKQNFYLANSYNLISIAKNNTNLMKFWNRLERYFNNEELKWFLTQKETSYNSTQLFLLTSHSDVSYVETFLNLTRFYLTKDEIRDLLLQKHPVTRESFLTRYIIIVRKVEILEINYNFAKEYLSHEELKSLIINKSGAEFIHKMSGNEKIFKFCMKILSEFYTKDEIIDMLMEIDEYKDTIVFKMVALGSKFNQRFDVADYLRKIFKGNEGRLKELLETRDTYGSSVFGRFTDSWHKEAIEPFLELAKEVFTDEEIKELYENKNIS